MTVLPVYNRRMFEENRHILSIDLKSFYASVECVDRGLDPFKTPLVVADQSRGDGTIVLAASPYIKSKYHVPSRCRLYEVPKDIKGLIIATPRMSRYLKMSALINCIYLDYVSQEDLYVYSIDESFLDVTHYLERNHDSAKSYARKIIRDIKERTGLTVTVGIGANIFMAKACMDIRAKKSPEFLSEWSYKDIPNELWPIDDLTKMWGIGTQMAKRLHALGFYTIGDIACSDADYLKKELGVIGEEIYYHSLGYDDAIIRENYQTREHSITCGQVLLRDYDEKEIPTLINDMSYELAERLFNQNVLAQEIILYLGYFDNTGYGLKATFYTPTDSSTLISNNLIRQFNAIDKISKPYRRITLVASKLSDVYCYQGTLFEDHQKNIDARNLQKTLIAIRKRYGADKAMPGSALSSSSNYLTRKHQIGGHKA